MPVKTRRMGKVWEPAKPAKVSESVVSAPDQTLRQLQVCAHWGAHTYGAEFRGDASLMRDVKHAVTHVGKALGHFSALVDDHDHAARDLATVASRADAAKYAADLIIVAARILDRWPGGPIDVQAAVTSRMREKGIGGPR